MTRDWIIYDRDPIRQAIQSASLRHGVSVEEILGDSHTRRIVKPRWEAMEEAKDAGMSFMEIGRRMRRDHTSVMHAYEQIKIRKENGTWQDH